MSSSKCRWTLAVVAAAMVWAVWGCRSTPPQEDDQPQTEQIETEQPPPQQEGEPTDQSAVPSPDQLTEDEPDERGETEETEETEDEKEDPGEQVASHVDARIESALEEADAGDDGAAIEALERLVGEPEGGFLAAYNLGVLYDRRGDTGSASDYYAEALRRQPDFSPALTNLVRMYLRGDAGSEAEAVARNFIDERPDNLDHRASLLEVWLADGRYEDVVERARDLLREDVQHVGAMYQMATAKFHLGRYELAESILRRAVDLAPERADLYYLFAQVSYAQDNTDEARDNFRAAIERQPRFPEARNNYAILLHDAGNFDRAIGQLERAVDDAPNYVEAWVNLGNAHKAQGDYGEAEEAYRQALGIDDQNADAHYNLGLLYLEAPIPGMDDIPRYEQAIEAFEAFRDSVGPQRASETPVASYINEASKEIEDERERLEALREAQQQDEQPQQDGDEDEGGPEDDEPADGEGGDQ